MISDTRDVAVGESRLKIAIALCTRARPVLLQRCLQSLLALDLPEGVEAVAVVVENGEAPSCQGLVEEIARRAPAQWQMAYVLEPILGIPRARNRSIEVALEFDPVWIAFIDDDEEADRDWLAAMLRNSRQFDADVLQGPVDYVYGPETPDWLVPKRFKRRASGARIETAFTNNVMMKAVIARSGLRFDETLQFSGGEDSDFFYRVADAGWILRWADDAIVSESVPANRLTLRWQLSRAMRAAANATQSHIRRRGWVSALLTHGTKGIRRILRGAISGVAGAVLIPFSVRAGKRAGFNGLRYIWSGTGSIIALFGVTPEPYRTVDGS